MSLPVARGVNQHRGTRHAHEDNAARIQLFICKPHQIQSLFVMEISGRVPEARRPGPLEFSREAVCRVWSVGKPQSRDTPPHSCVAVVKQWKARDAAWSVKQWKAREFETDNLVRERTAPHRAGLDSAPRPTLRASVEYGMRPPSPRRSRDRREGARQGARRISIYSVPTGCILTNDFCKTLYYWRNTVVRNSVTCAAGGDESGRTRLGEGLGNTFFLRNTVVRNIVTVCSL